METSVYIIEPIRTREIDEEKGLERSSFAQCSGGNVFYSRLLNICSMLLRVCTILITRVKDLKCNIRRGSEKFLLENKLNNFLESDL